MFKSIINTYQEIELNILKNMLAILLATKSESKYCPEKIILQINDMEEKIAKLEKELFYND